MGQGGEIAGLTLELPSFPATRNTTQANTMKSFERHWATGLVFATVLPSVHSTSSGSMYLAYSVFSGSTCTKVTYVSFLMDSNYDSNCKADGCSEWEGYSYTYSCVPDYSKFASSSFGESPYLVAQAYTDESCTTESYVEIYLADGKCHVSGGTSFTATLNSDGSGVLANNQDEQCKEDEYKTTLPKDKLTAHSCMWYTAYSAYNHATTTPAATTATPSPATPAATTATQATVSSGSGLLLASSLLAATLGGLVVIFQ